MRLIYKAAVIFAMTATILSGCGGNGNIKKLCAYIEAGEDDKALAIIETSGNLDRESVPLAGNGQIFTQGEQEVRTPLYSACKVGNAAMVEALLEHGADPNYTGQGLEMPLEIYCAENIDGDISIMEMLVRHGADVNAFTYGPAVFRVANKLKYLDGEKAAAAVKMITFLLDNGAEFICEENGSPWTLLHCAVQTPDTGLLRVLLEDYDGSAYADVEDYEGDTALDLARDLGFKETVDLLERYGRR